MKLSKTTKIVTNDGQITFNRYYGAVTITDGDDSVIVEPGKNGPEKLKRAFLDYISGFQWGSTEEGLAFMREASEAVSSTVGKLLEKKAEEDEAKLKAEAPVLTLVTDGEGA